MEYYEIMLEDIEKDEKSRNYVITMLTGFNDHTKLKKITVGDKVFPRLTKQLVTDINSSKEDIESFNLWDLFYCLILNKMLQAIKIYDARHKNKPLFEDKDPYKETRESLQNKWKTFYEAYIKDCDTVGKMIKKAIIHSRNILIIYKKIIGIPIVDTLLSTSLLKKKKTVVEDMSINVIYLNEELTFKYCISRKIPDIAIKNDGYVPSKTIRADDFKAKDNVQTPVATSTTEPIHDHDFMCSIIHEPDVQFGSMGKFSINTSFGYQFFSIFYNILEKSITNNNAINFGLDKKEMLFMKSLYGINFDLIDDENIKKKILGFALQFQNTTKLKLTVNDVCRVSRTLLVDIINKIYAKKFEIMEIFFCVNIFLSFEHFKMNTFCDKRGRQYPEPSVFNYLNKLACQFFNFSIEYTRMHLGENLEKAKNYIKNHILEQYPNLQDYLSLSCLDDVLQNFDKLNIKLNKVFHTSTLLQDYNNISQNKDENTINYKLEANESQDARSSGLQVGAMETLCERLAIIAGLIIHKTEIPDIYSQISTLINDQYIPKLVKMGKHFIRGNKRLNQELTVSLEGMGDTYSLNQWLNSTRFYTFIKEQRKKFQIKSLNLKENNHNILNSLKKYIFFSKGLLSKLKRKCDFPKILTHEDNMFFKTIEILILYFCYKKLEPFQKLINRNFVKHKVMIDFYGGGGQTRQVKMKESFFSQYLSSTEILPPFEKHLHFFLSIFVIAIDIYSANFLRKTIPEAFIIIETVSALSKEKLFAPGIIKTQHVSWEYMPLIVDARVKSLFNKKYKVYQHTDETDYDKYATAFVANFIQLLDATLAKIIRRLKNQELPMCPLIINHDCFKFPYIFHDEMMDLIRRAYQEFTDCRYLEKNLLCDEVFNTVYSRKVRDIPNFRYFRGEDINGVLVKP